jgi:hypothetical protein
MSVVARKLPGRASCFGGGRSCLWSHVAGTVKRRNAIPVVRGATGAGRMPSCAPSHRLKPCQVTKQTPFTLAAEAPLDVRVRAGCVPSLPSSFNRVWGAVCAGHAPHACPALLVSLHHRWRGCFCQGQF